MRELQGLSVKMSEAVFTMLITFRISLACVRLFYVCCFVDYQSTVRIQSSRSETIPPQEPIAIKICSQRAEFQMSLSVARPQRYADTISFSTLEPLLYQ
jgi:hypothetical protein